MVKTRFLIIYSIVCTMVLIRTCTNDDMLAGFDLREISGVEFPPYREIRRCKTQYPRLYWIDITYSLSADNKRALQKRLEDITGKPCSRWVKYEDRYEFRDLNSPYDIFVIEVNKRDTCFHVSFCY